jgi:hypothetical protein
LRGVSNHEGNWFGRRRASTAPRTTRFEEIPAPGGRHPISENGNEKARDRFPGAGFHVLR